MSAAQGVVSVMTAMYQMELRFSVPDVDLTTTDNVVRYGLLHVRMDDDTWKVFHPVNALPDSRDLKHPDDEEVKKMTHREYEDTYETVDMSAEALESALF